MSVWPDLSGEERSKLTMQEENAIKNQIILFINRIINMRTPVDFSKGALFESSCYFHVVAALVGLTTSKVI